MTKKAIAALAVLLVLGCKAPWMRNVQGSSLSVGITLPTEELVQVQALNDLDGAKWHVQQPALVVYKFESCCTNTYFGVVKRTRWQKSYMLVDPSATNTVEIVRDELAAEQHR